MRCVYAALLCAALLSRCCGVLVDVAVKPTQYLNRDGSDILTFTLSGTSVGAFAYSVRVNDSSVITPAGTGVSRSLVLHPRYLSMCFNAVLWCTWATTCGCEPTVAVAVGDCPRSFIARGAATATATLRTVARARFAITIVCLVWLHGGGFVLAAVIDLRVPWLCPSPCLRDSRHSSPHRRLCADVDALQSAVC